MDTLCRRLRSRSLCLGLLAVVYASWIGYVLYQDRPLDFYTYYLASYGFAHGMNIYELQGGENGQASQMWASLAAATGVTWYAPAYLYPPLTALIVWPLTGLPPRWAAGVWLVASAAAIIAAVWLLGRTSRLSYGVHLGYALLLCFFPPLVTLYAGQVNGLVLFALALAYYSLRRSDVGLGAAAGAAALLKVVPLAHVLYLAWRRRWRAFLIGCGVITGLSLASLPLVGSSGLAWYLRYGASLGQPGSQVPTGANQTLNGFLSRLLLAAQAAGLVTDAASVGPWLWLALSLILVAATVALCWPASHADEGSRRSGASQAVPQLEFALVTTAVVMIPPFTWYHQFVLLLIPLFVLVEHSLTRPALRWMLVPLAAGYLATDIHGLIWHWLEPYPLLVSSPFLTATMIWGLLAWLIVREKLGREQTSAGRETPLIWPVRPVV
jgi:hypothetical protein